MIKIKQLVMWAGGPLVSPYMLNNEYFWEGTIFEVLYSQVIYDEIKKLLIEYLKNINSELLIFIDQDNHKDEINRIQSIKYDNLLLITMRGTQSEDDKYSTIYFASHPDIINFAQNTYPFLFQIIDIPDNNYVIPVNNGVITGTDLKNLHIIESKSDINKSFKLTIKLSNDALIETRKAYQKKIENY